MTDSVPGKRERLIEGARRTFHEQGVEATIMLPTLAVAVDTMARVQLGKELSPEEIGLIIEFLQTLTGSYRGALVRAPTPGAG